MQQVKRVCSALEMLTDGQERVLQLQGEGRQGNVL